MRYCVIITFLLAVFSCNDRKTKTPEKTSTSNPDTLVQQTLPAVDKDTSVSALAKNILTSIKSKHYTELAGYFHPVLGVRFSPYGYIDTTRDIKLTAKTLLEEIGKKNKINWGTYDGTGDKIELTVDQYFKKFVYSADFLNAEKTNINNTIAGGNSFNNLETIYKDCNFTESYFSGFDKKYDGMDWCSLKLVFKNYEGKIYLVGIIHDQWTV